jgi:hypothetical protein
VKRLLLTSLGLLALLAMSACAGTVLGGKANCSGSAALITQVTGECERTIDELTEAETQHIAVQTADLAPFATVDFEVSVDSGRVRVIFVDSRGDEQSSEAWRDHPASGNVRVQLDPLNQINFKLEPVGGPAGEVAYHLSFVCDCMP